MKKYNRQPEKFEIFDLFSTLAPGWDLQFNDEKSVNKFCEKIAKSLRANSKPTMLYGRYAESMFGYVAASLGECVIIKKEDDGDVFTDIDEIKIPDYRIITKNKGAFLVEVKNFHKDNNIFELNHKYLMQLQKYAEINGAELKIAVYWSKWNIWTLLSPQSFSKKENKRVITILEAIKQNEMGTILGDVFIGTLPRLSLKIYVDHITPGLLPESEEVGFRIKDVEVYCGDQVVSDKEERRMAITLMMCGKWVEQPPKTFVSEGYLNAIEFIFTPEEYDESQNFALIGSMSSVVSNHYKMYTAPRGTIEKITFSDNITNLGFIIPKDYVGSQLPLWRFHQTVK